MQTTDLNTAAPEAETDAKTDAYLIREAIEDIRPTLRRDGGDISLHKIEGDLVVVEMTGACVGCVLATVTVSGIRKIISEKVGRPMKVIPRSAFVPVRRLRPASATRRSIQITEGSAKVKAPA